MDRGEGEYFEAGANSTEQEAHQARIAEKIACFYSKNYQIPDQPKIKPFNTNKMDLEKLMEIKLPEDDFTMKDDGEDDLSIDLSKESVIKEAEEKESGFDDLEEITVSNKLQLFKEPRRGILKKRGDEDNKELERWNSVGKLMTFLGMNEQSLKDFAKETSKENFNE